MDNEGVGRVRPAPRGRETEEVFGDGPYLVAYEYQLPSDEWEGWVPGHGIERVAREIADRLTERPEARSTVARAIELLNEDALTKGTAIVRQAVWVPDPRSGEVAAVLDTTVLASRRGALTLDRHLSRGHRRKFGWRTRVVEYDATVFDVPAGRVAYERTLLRPFGEREVQAYLFFTVFAPGADEGFCFLLNTIHLELRDGLEEHGRAMAASVQLTLGDAPDRTVR